MQFVLAWRFNSLQDLDGTFERVTRYETALWRQARQVLLALASSATRLSPRHRARMRHGRNLEYSIQTTDHEVQPYEANRQGAHPQS